jgi:hypothetical protein
MANLIETPTFEAGIYQFETTDPLQGGPGGVDNLPHRQLANRTQALKTTQDAEVLRLTGHIGSGGTSHAAATTVSAGYMSASDKVRLNNAALSSELAAAMAGFTGSLGAAGWFAIPLTGIATPVIIQWRRVEVAGSDFGNFPFPIAFPTACLFTLASKGADIPDGDSAVGCEPASRFAWTVTNSRPTPELQGIFLLAIGH